MNLDQMKADAEDLQSHDWARLCESWTFDLEHTPHIENSSPANMLKLLAVVDALKRVRSFIDGSVAGMNVIDDALTALEAA